MSPATARTIPAHAGIPRRSARMVPARAGIAPEPAGTDAFVSRKNNVPKDAVLLIPEPEHEGQ